MVKLGVIGCAGIATHQLNSVWEDNLFELVAGADIRTEQLDLFKEKFGLQHGYTDYRKMLEEADIEAVMVCTPTFLHAENVFAAARAGKQVFCQKPMAMTSYDCHRMIQVCKDNNVGLQLGFVRRYDNDWGTLKQVLDSGVLGRPVQWRQIAGGPPPASPFFMDRFQGGGPMIDGMVHNYDFACYCFGKPVEVKSMPMKIHHTSTALDTGTVLIRFENDDTVTCSWSWGLPEGVRANSRTEVLGPNGILFFPGSYDAAKAEGKYDPKTQGAYLLSQAGGKEEVVTFQKKNMFQEEMRHFADWVTKGTQPMVTGEDGLRATRIAELALNGGRV
ncbi:MAG: Gfo/Idh/MocA family oxidoreductase [bacterium]|nr:Gfo/Idh/MocA family oxidoreductase [bacterium]